MRNWLGLIALLPIFMVASCSTLGRNSVLQADNVGTPWSVTSDGTPNMSTKAELQEFVQYDGGPYIIGPGDTLRLKSLSKDYADEDLKVTPDGFINVTSNGLLKVSKKSVPIVEKEINELLAKRYDNVEIKLILTLSANSKVLIFGDIRSPGIVPLENEMTVLDAIAKSGGFVIPPVTVGTAPGQVGLDCRIVRENGKSVWIDLNRILFQDSKNLNLVLRNNDILYIYEHS